MNGDNQPTIVFRNVSLAFGGQDVLKDISFEVAREQVLCLLGRSGMGKTVTLKLIVGLLKPDTGTILVENENIANLDEDGLSKIRRQIGFLFQDAALFDSLSLYDNLALPLQRLRKGMPTEQIRAFVQKNLDDVGLGRDSCKMPAELSGGMRKRAGLARALMLQPCILLVDEPSSGLDRVTESEIDDLLLSVRKRSKPTMLIVTHDIREARRLGDRIGVLDHASLIAIGSIDELATHENALVRALVSEAQ